MKKKRKWIKWVVLLLIVAAAAWMYLRVSQTGESAAYREMQATQGSMATYYNFDGVVVARRSQTITAQAADTVEKVYVKRNEQVDAGDRLYKTGSGEVVKADIDGEITGLHITQGDVIAAGMATVEIIDMDSLEAELNVDEYDVAAVRPGAAVQVTVLALERVLEGEVIALDKNGTAVGDLSYYTANVSLEDAQDVFPGMQISAKVLRTQVDNGVLLKLDALQFNEYNEPFVSMYDKNGEDVIDVPVTVGASDGKVCEITSGLSAGDTVLVPSGMSMMELMEMMRSSRMGS